MAGAAINLKIDDREVIELLSRIQKNLADLKPAMKIIGSIVRTLIVRNFEKGGRPLRCKKHSRLTERKRGSKAKILMVKGLAGGQVVLIIRQTKTV